MCGIAGIANIGRKELNICASIMSMSETIRHRGPDDEGYVLFNDEGHRVFVSKDSPEDVTQSYLPFCSKEVIGTHSNQNYTLALSHRRLSIIDRGPNGHQPMCKFDGQYWITYNGEIYNYVELKKTLSDKGHSFIGRSDTEVILAAYQEWGKDCVSHFNGMWAFVLYDRTESILFASRDRFGVKPFYYYYEHGIFHFASEQKAIAQLPHYKKEINPKAIYDFWVKHEEEQEEEGFFKGIMELFPANNLTLDLKTGSLIKEKYYTLSINNDFQPFDEKEYEQHIEKTKALFIDGIHLHLRSEVEVGSCLSGGIDSSAIAGIMSSLSNKEKPFHSFTAIFPNEKMDESKWAQEVVRTTNTVWHTITPTADGLFKELNELVYSQDIPLWSSSTYAQYKVMELCKKKGIKVVLDGQGGDELFAGYFHYFAQYWNDLYRKKGVASAFDELMKKGDFPKSSLLWLKYHIKQQHPEIHKNSIRLKTHPEQYLSADLNRRFNQKKEIKKYLSLNEMLRDEFVTSKLKLLLKCEDRCSMWHSVESRTPFADHLPLIENTFAIPGSFKMRNGTTKSLLRESLKQYLPLAIYHRKDKIGYETPHTKWLQSNKKMALELIDTLDDPYLNKMLILKKFDQLCLDGDNSVLFKTLTYAVWKNVFKMTS